MAGSDVSLVEHLLPKVNEGFISTLGSSVSAGASSIPLTDITGLTNGSTFVGIVEPGATNQQVFTGLVDTSGSQITNVKWTRGADVSHAGGSTVVDYVTGTAVNMISRWAGIEHNDDGTHGDVTAESLDVSGDASVDGELSVVGATILALLTASNVTLTGKSSGAVQSIASGATLTPNMDNYNSGECTALTTNAAVAAPSGTPANGQWYLLTITASGGTRTLSWNAAYVVIGSGVSLPTSLASGKTAVISWRYSSARSRMEVLGASVEA